MNKYLFTRNTNNDYTVTRVYCEGSFTFNTWTDKILYTDINDLKKLACPVTEESFLQTDYSIIISAIIKEFNSDDEAMLWFELTYREE